MPPIIGLDVGATKIRAGLVSARSVTNVITLPTQPQRGRQHILNTVVRAIRQLHRSGITTVGIGWAGQIDTDRGYVISSPNMGRSFKNVPVARFIKRQTGLRAIIENDVKCFALGESLRGAGKNFKHVIGLTLGTGIGGGIVMNGRLYHGRDGSAGEFGHMLIDPGGRLCGCGRRGHLEAYASGTAMVKYYRALSGRTHDTFYIEQRAIAGERQARKVVQSMANHLAIGLSNILHTLNPDVIVIGGGIANIPLLWKLMRPQLKRQLLYPALAQTPIVKSRLKSLAAIIGAAELSRRR